MKPASRSARALAAAAALASSLPLSIAAGAGAVYPGAARPTVSIEQRLGADLPLAATFVDADGRAVRLGDYFAGATDAHAVPVVLVLGYYHCPNLCQTVMQGTLEALADSGASRRSYRVVAVSIDPAETAADARAARRRDLAWADLAEARARKGRAPTEALALDALVGPPASIERLARAAGFGFERVAESGDAAASFAHASGFLVVTPEGRVSRYFLGVRHDAKALGTALDDAAGDGIGGLVDRLVLLCAHVDPTLGRFSADVLLVVRVLGVGLVLGLAAWLWRHRSSPPPAR
jgi:protein SCO1/2